VEILPDFNHGAPKTAFNEAHAEALL